MKTYTFLLIFFITISCGSTKNMNFSNVSSTAKNIDGSYENTNFKVLELLDRSQTKDTLHNFNLASFKSFSISNSDGKELKISISDDEGKIISRTYKFKKEKNIYYLKNKNVKSVLIPYLAGALDEKRLYLYIDNNNDLKINVFKSRSGAILFIGFLDWKSSKDFYTFKRIP